MSLLKIVAAATENSSFGVADGFVWVFGIIGTICIAAYTIPGLISFFKTKNTLHVGIPMYILLSIGAVAFVISGIVQIATAADKSFEKIGLPVCILVANLICGTSTIMQLIAKLFDIKKQK